MDMQMHVVKETLRELGIVDKTTVTVFNKTDRFKEQGTEDGMHQIPRDFSSDYQARISARTGEGIDGLEQILRTITVSYTHLDVYKRQGRSRRRKSRPRWKRSFS